MLEAEDLLLGGMALQIQDRKAHFPAAESGDPRESSASKYLGDFWLHHSVHALTDSCDSNVIRLHTAFLAFYHTSEVL